MLPQGFGFTRLRGPHLTRSLARLSATLTTPALDRRSSRWFAAPPARLTAEGLPPSLAQHTSGPPLCGGPEVFRTHIRRGFTRNALSFSSSATCLRNRGGSARSAVSRGFSPWTLAAAILRRSSLTQTLNIPASIPSSRATSAIVRSGSITMRSLDLVLGRVRPTLATRHSGHPSSWTAVLSHSNRHDQRVPVPVLSGLSNLPIARTETTACSPCCPVWSRVPTAAGLRGRLSGIERGGSC